MMKMLMKLQKLIQMRLMNNVLFISEKTIKENSLVSNNVDGKYIQNAIKTAQDISLQPIIGSKMFKKISRMIQEDALDELYSNLLKDYIQPILINSVMSDLVLQLTYKFRNMGSVQTTDTNLVLPSLRDLQYIREDYNLKAQFYMNRLSDYLEANCTKFKDYPGCGCGELKAKRTAYKNNLTL